MWSSKPEYALATHADTRKDNAACRRHAQKMSSLYSCVQ